MTELQQAKLQMCQMLGQIGVLQQQVAQLQSEKLQHEISSDSAKQAQAEHDAADAEGRATGAPPPCLTP